MLKIVLLIVAIIVAIIRVQGLCPMAVLGSSSVNY
jgi:hypothetical protein